MIMQDIDSQFWPGNHPPEIAFLIVYIQIFSHMLKTFISHNTTLASQRNVLHYESTIKVQANYSILKQLLNKTTWD